MELPQKPLVVLSGDFAQLQPIGRGGAAARFCTKPEVRQIVMEQHEFARSKDPVLLQFLRTVRSAQPSREQLRDFFGARYLGVNMRAAVQHCIRISGDGPPMTWLTCLSKGANEVNYEYLRALGYGDRETICSAEDSFPCDPDYGSVPMRVRPGMCLRLTRNLDKERGFVNGALGVVTEVLSLDPAQGPVFAVRLSHGCRVLVHPIRDKDRGAAFLPCAYGYAMTTRKAQGATLAGAVLYFDFWRPADRGLGYVAASRVKEASGLYYFGTIRRRSRLVFYSKRF